MSDISAGTEPIFWQSTKLSANDVERQTIVNQADGKRSVIRHPQHGHIGAYETRQRAAGIRYVNVLRHDGNIAPLVLTNAAADTDSGGGYGNLMRSKARHFGWFSPAACACALVANGQLHPELVFDKSIIGQMPCPIDGPHSEDKPCPHTAAEIVARRAAKQRYEAEKALEYKSEAEKALAEANSNTAKLLEQVVAQGANQNAMLEMFGKFLASLAQNPPPAPTPPEQAAAPAPSAPSPAEKAPKK